MPELTAAQIAQMTGGRLVGPADRVVHDIRSIEKAGPEDISFIAEEKDLPAARDCEAGVLVAPAEPEDYPGSVVVCQDPSRAIVPVLEAFALERFPAPHGVSDAAFISPSARIGEGAAVGEGVFVGENTVVGEEALLCPGAYVGRDCRIGARTEVHPHATVRDRVIIGEDCVIHFNAAIGAAGFGFLQHEGRHVKQPQVGRVRIGDRVEIGALSSVDRAMLEETVIEDGVKVDNHCHVAHNCHVGPDCIMAGYARLGGSVHVGRGVIIAADVAVTDHVNIGEGAVLAAGAGIHRDVEPGEVLLGRPGRDISEQRRIYALTGRLPGLFKRLRKLEKKVDELSRRTEKDDTEG